MLVALARDLEERLAALQRDARRARRTRGSRWPRRRRRRPRPTAWRTRARPGRRARRGARASRPPRAAGLRRARRRGVRRPARRSRARRRRPRRRPRPAVARGGERDDALGVARVGRDELVAVALAVADPDRHAQRQLGRRARAARRAARRARGARRSSSDRLVDERRQVGHGAASRSSSGRARGLLVQEGLVARVLEQAAHQVGHAGHEVADRAVGAHAQARGRRARAGGRRRGRAAPAARGRASAPPRRAVGGDRVGDRAQVVRGDRRGARAGRASSSRRVSASKLRSRVGLDLEDGRVPAVLAGLDDLVVPVGALDEAHDQRAARRRRLAAQATIRSQQLRRVAQVGLQHQPRGRAVAELVLGEQLEHEVGDRLARVEGLHVDVQVRAELAWRGAAARAAAARRRACRAPARRGAAAA